MADSLGLCLLAGSVDAPARAAHSITCSSSLLWLWYVLVAGDAAGGGRPYTIPGQMRFDWPVCVRSILPAADPFGR